MLTVGSAEEQKLDKEGPSTQMSPDANIEKTVLTSPDCQFINPSVGLGAKTQVSLSHDSASVNFSGQ